MKFTYIIIMWIIFVFLIALVCVLSVCNKKYRVSKDMDFFTYNVNKKKEKLKKSDLNISFDLYISIMMVLPIVVGFFSYYISKNITISLIIAAISLFVPEVILIIMQHKLNREFAERYARSLEQLAFSLKAGMSILQAVQDVANNKFIHETIRQRYRRLSSDLQMGISVAEAFKRFADSTNSKDAKDVALAIDIQNEVGGHEAETIMSIASDIHQRIMLRRELKSMFSGTSSMIYIMDFIPIGIMIFLGVTDRTYADFYFNDAINFIIFVILICTCISGSIVNHYKLSSLTKGD